MAVVAYSLWGLLPIYWKLLGAVPAIEVLTHRIVWSLGFIAVLLFARRGWRRTLGFLRDRETRGAMLLSTALIATNWFIFIWAVSADRVTEASLGYYINPLLNVALARVFLGERLRPLQGVAVALAAIGVVTLTVMRGELPWVSVVLAVSFALYGLVRKRTPVGAVEGLAIETGLVTPLAIGYLLLLSPPLGHLVTADPVTVGLLVGAGVITAVPLLAFAGAARRLRYTTLGMIQYLAPTLQLGCAVLLYGEAFTQAHAITFGLIWIAVLLYVIDMLRRPSPDPAPARST
ncbi:MAG: EamA family transporter RarD [Sandaracinaceae bacterium]|nr:MAG: EamA family transporter RarD [Sandaracinaceae bacterium]